MNNDSAPLAEGFPSARRGHRNPRSRAHSRASNRRDRQTESAALNCIVDDSALLAGIVRDQAKDSNLKRWIADGVINIFVPLYTLERLNLLRGSAPPVNLDARKTLEWLDHITTATETKRAGRVQLQGPDDQYHTWAEVEQHLLPATPFSDPAVDDGEDDYDEADLDGDAEATTHELDRSLRLDDDDDATTDTADGVIPPDTLQPPASTSASSVLELDTSTSSSSSSGGIPPRVRPLLNFVVWRTHHTDPTLSSTSRYILLTNDAQTQKQAQKFGVRAKMLAQVRAIIARDTPPTHHHHHHHHHHHPPHPPPRSPRATARRPFHSPRYRGDALARRPSADDPDDTVVFTPARPGSSRSAAGEPELFDPDHFGRTPTSPAQRGFPAEPARRGPRRGERSRRGRRGGRGDAEGARHEYAKPIDPDSYARPPPTTTTTGSGRRGRGASVGRLWQPDG